jgi:TfoX/Sxy family transcriptional regulator of competence genes
MSTNKRPMPKWTKAPDQLVAYLEEIMGGHPGVELKKMFGYPVAFTNGQMACGVFQESLMMRLSYSDRKNFLEKYDTRLFEPMPGRPMKEYVLIPDTLINEAKLLRPWIEKSLAYVGSIPKKPKPKAKASKKKQE